MLNNAVTPGPFTSPYVLAAVKIQMTFEYVTLSESVVSMREPTMNHHNLASVTLFKCPRDPIAAAKHSTLRHAPPYATLLHHRLLWQFESNNEYEYRPRPHGLRRRPLHPTHY